MQGAIVDVGGETIPPMLLIVCDQMFRAGHLIECQGSIGSKSFPESAYDAGALNTHNGLVSTFATEPGLRAKAFPSSTWIVPCMW